MENKRPLGIIAAMPEEIRQLGDALAVDDKVVRGGFSFRLGRLDAIPAVLVEAGIGKVNAALVAALLLDRFGCRALLLTGVAGGLDPTLAVGDVVVAERLIQHDYGALVGGRIQRFRPGVPPFGEPRDRLDYELDPAIGAALRKALADFVPPALPAAATGGASRLPALRFGTVLSGDQFINSVAKREELFAAFAAQAVEMEGAAVAQVAERFGAPCIVVRSLSDLAGADSHLDFTAFLAASATVAAAVLRRILPAI